MPLTPQQQEEVRRKQSKGGRNGGYGRKICLSDEELTAIGLAGANARWAGKTPEERKIERAKGRGPKPGTAEIEPNSKAEAARA